MINVELTVSHIAILLIFIAIFVVVITQRKSIIKLIFRINKDNAEFEADFQVEENILRREANAHVKGQAQSYPNKDTSEYENRLSP